MASRAGATALAMAGAAWLFSTLVVATAATPSPTCTEQTAVSLSTSWAGGRAADSDLFYVAISAAPGEKPFALQTSASPSTTIHDLLPSTDYYLR